MPSPATDARVALAAVAGAHGVRGEVKLKLFGDSIDNLARQPSLTVGGKPLLLKDVRAGNKTAIARFEGVASREAAEALRGSLVEIDRIALPPLGDGEYYHADLIGLPCVDGDGVALGTVAAIEDYGAGELLDIEKADGKRSLIPYRDGIADLVDGRIILDPDFLA
ncbi:MAG: ribosome maturation factor RimM [Sphingomonas bacterium]|nr:ribosome maturation factor RimM [Sphingomonas bacterium]